MNIVAYKLVASADFEKVDVHVNRLLAEGWQPYGPPFIRPEHAQATGGGPMTVAHQLVQAMVQYEFRDEGDE